MTPCISINENAYDKVEEDARESDTNKISSEGGNETVDKTSNESSINGTPKYKRCPCPRIFWPVCGSDKKIYGNKCLLDCAINSDYGKSINLRREDKGKYDDIC